MLPHQCTCGLRYTNDPREALREFNFARKDTKWGGPAILHMVEVGVILCMHSALIKQDDKGTSPTWNDSSESTNELQWPTVPMQIYLNPDNDAVWAEQDSTDSAEQREAVATARSLLAQVCEYATASMVPPFMSATGCCNTGAQPRHRLKSLSGELRRAANVMADSE
jgi:hypothetical protein